MFAPPPEYIIVDIKPKLTGKSTTELNPSEVAILPKIVHTCRFIHLNIVISSQAYFWLSPHDLDTFPNEFIDIDEQHNVQNDQ